MDTSGVILAEVLEGARMVGARMVGARMVVVRLGLVRGVVMFAIVLADAAGKRSIQEGSRWPLRSIEGKEHEKVWHLKKRFGDFAM